MRFFSTCVAALGIFGCVYVGGINHAPEGKIEPQQSSMRLFLKGSITLKSTGGDEDGDEMTREWRVAVTSSNRLYFLTKAQGPGNTALATSGNESPSISNQEELTLDHFPVLGKYTVELKLKDSDGAAVTDTYTFEVKNTDPVVKLRLDVDPDFPLTSAIPDSLGQYPSHAPYLVRLDPDRTDDWEGDLRCGVQGPAGSARVTWSLAQIPAGAKVQYQTTVRCKEGELLDRLRFRLTGGQGGKVVVKADVEDGRGGKGSASLDLVLTRNRAPCIRDSEPPLSAEKVTVVASSGLPFGVTELDDDLVDGHIFTWLIRDKGDTGPFLQIKQGSSPSYVMDPWFRFPGEELDLRVIIQDPLSALPACGEETDRCSPSPKPKGWPAGCYQWVTWQVLFK